MEITVPANDVADTRNPYIFLKEISTDGNVNTVDVIYPALTALSVLAPEWIALLLDPIVNYMQKGAWTQDYVIHDIGKGRLFRLYPTLCKFCSIPCVVYPNAIGDTDPEDVILENTGSFFIMVYAYEKLTGDNTWTKMYAALFEKYANYLINNGLYPSSQLDTVDSIPATANQTNLAIVSAIGLNAYGAVTGNITYTQAAQNFAQQIYTNGLGTDQPGNNATHFTYNYHDASSWGTLFNLFPDQWLGLNTFPKTAVTMQCNWYSAQLTSVGLPYASVQNDLANGMWDMWVAAICPGALQEKLFADEVGFLGNGKNTAPFPDRYYVSGAQAGEFVGGRARPTLGSTFALLAMNGFTVTWS